MTTTMMIPLMMMKIVRLMLRIWLILDDDVVVSANPEPVEGLSGRLLYKFTRVSFDKSLAEHFTVFEGQAFSPRGMCICNSLPEEIHGRQIW